MLVFIMLIFAQSESIGSKPAPLNAQVVFENGEKLDMVDVSIKGFEAYSFEFYSGGQTEYLNIFRVVRISRIAGTNQHEVLFDTGEKKLGQVKGFSLQAVTLIPPQNFDTVHLHHLERVQFVSGEQLRSCAEGHFEERTPHPHCPVCGAVLDLGGYEENEDKESALPRTHRLRLDSRTPSGRGW